MLDELAVRNLGILDEARIEPGPGLVVVTGETGTGKTLLLGALELLLGFAARPDLVGPLEDETFLEGRFVDRGGEEVVVARRIRKAGRSRAYLNGEMASLKTIERRMSGLVEVVAQHDHLAVGREGELRTLIDRLLDEKGQKAAQAYRSAWESLRAVESVRSELGGDRRALERERELAAWQVAEIAQSGFSRGDDLELARHADLMRNADSLLEELSQARHSAGGANEELGKAVTSLRKAARLAPDLDRLAQEAEAAAETLGQLMTDLRVAADEVVHDPSELELIESKLALLGDLRRKYGQTLDDVLAFMEAAESRSTELEEILERSVHIEQDYADALAVVEQAGKDLVAARRHAAQRLSATTVSHLEELGFSDPVVEVALEEGPARRHGTDRVSLRFSSDRRLDPAPVTRVASGGELSRLVLALRLAGGAGEAPVIAFDEIDAGVGGRTALALGKKLAQLSEGRQVLVVTHLPQVAAFADVHYAVDRDGTSATVRCLDESAQVDELARMLAGLDDSEQGRGHAEELRQTALALRG